MDLENLVRSLRERLHSNKVVGAFLRRDFIVAIRWLHPSGSIW